MVQIGAILSVSSDDTSFGEFKGPLQMQMYVELSDDALQLSKFGFDPGDEFTGFLHISTFHTAASAYFDYSLRRTIHRT